MKRWLILSLQALCISGSIMSQHWSLLCDVGNNAEGIQPPVHLDGEQMAVDQSGNIYIAGRFIGGEFPGLTNDLDLPELRLANNYFVAKYGNEGNLLWASPIYSDLDYISGSIGLTGVHNIRFLYVDDLQNIYVGGSFIYQVLSTECESEILDQEVTHAYFAKFNSAGECQYIRTGITESGGYCTDIAKAGNGKLYVSCSFKGFVRFSDTTIVATSNPIMKVTESIIAEIDDQGSILKYSILSSGTGNGRCEISQIHVNENNTLVCAGRCSGRIIFNDQSAGPNILNAQAFAILLTEDLQPLQLQDWLYGIATNGNVYEISDLFATGDGGYAMSGFFIADKFTFSGRQLVTEDPDENSGFGLFHNFLATFNFDGEPGILVTTASLTRNGTQRVSVETCADKEYIYVLTGIRDSGTIGNLMVHDNPDILTQYLAVLDPVSGACVHLEDLDEGQSLGIEIVNNKIAIAGLFRIHYQLEDKVVYAQSYKDIYFALRDKIVVNSTAVETPNSIFPLLYPNPAQDLLFLGDSFHNGAVIYNVHGTIIKHIPANIRKIDVSSLPQGMYFISSLSGNQKGNFIKL